MSICVKTAMKDISQQDTTRPICDFSLEELLPNTLTDMPAVSISMSDKIWAVAGLLSPHVESFVDSLVVTDGEHPVGSLDGMEVMREILRDPTFDFFNDTKIGKIKNIQLVITTKHTKLSELLNLWKETRKAFAIMPNQYHGYSVISAETILTLSNLNSLAFMSKKLLVLLKKFKSVAIFSIICRSLIKKDVSSRISLLALFLYIVEIISLTD